MALILRIAFHFKHSTQSAEVGYTFDGACDFTVFKFIVFFPHSQPMAAMSTIRKQRLLIVQGLSDGCMRRISQLQTCGSSKETQHTPPDRSACQIEAVCQHISVSVQFSHYLFCLSSGIPSIICRLTTSHFSRRRHSHQAGTFKSPFVPQRTTLTWHPSPTQSYDDSLPRPQVSFCSS